MGYRIVYGQPFDMKKHGTINKTRLRYMIAVVFFVFSVCVRIFWQDGVDVLQQVFLPGDLTITEQAFSEMITDLRNGDSIGDSLTVFCSKILHESD